MRITGGGNMNHTEFFDKLKAGYAARGYLFTGEENFVKREALRRLEQKLLPEGLEALNENILEGKTADDIIAACETLPMMAERRLVVVRDYAPLMSGQSKGEKEESERLAEYLNRLPETCCLVMYMRGAADGRKALFKVFSAAKSAYVVEFAPLDDRELYTWLSSRFKRAGKSISRDVADQLKFRAGTDLTRLDGEADKLIAHAGERGEILPEDLDVVTPTLECTIFQLIDDLVAHNGAGAYRRLAIMHDGGEDDVRVLAMITRQMRFMAHIKLMQAKRVRDDEIIKALGINPYGLRNTRRQLGAFTEERLERAYRDCVDAEYAIKSGAMSDEEALGRLMLNWLNS